MLTARDILSCAREICASKSGLRWLVVTATCLQWCQQARRLRLREVVQFAYHRVVATLAHLDCGVRAPEEDDAGLDILMFENGYDE